MGRFVGVSSKGDFTEAERYLKGLGNINFKSELSDLAENATATFAAQTPKRSGKTSASWYYEIEKNGKGYDAQFYNSNVTKDNVSVPKIAYYGHGTGTGGYVAPFDYITPTLDAFNQNVSDLIERKIRDAK